MDSTISFQSQHPFSQSLIIRFFVLIALFTFIAIILSIPGHAAPELYLDYSTMDSPLQISLGGGSENFQYREYDSESELIMEEKGNLSTVNISSTLPFGGDFLGQRYSFTRLEGSFSFGNLTYDGETWGGTPLTGVTDDKIYRLEGDFGVTYDVGQAIFAPYVGISFKHWYNDFQDYSWGYERRITQYYWLGGATLRFELGPNALVSLGGNTSTLWRGTVKSYLSDVDPGYNDPSADQENGNGIKAYARTLLDILGLTVKLEAFGTYLDVAKSESVLLEKDGESQGLVYEPQNTTITYGFNISWMWN